MLRNCILILISALGDDSFHDRESATLALRSLGSLAISEVSANRKHSDPEIAYRCRLLFSDYVSSYRPTRGTLMPWIDMLPPDYPDRERRVLHLLPWPEGPGPGGDWPNYRYATVRLVEELIEAGTPRPAVIALLDKMVTRENEYRKTHGLPPFPELLPQPKEAWP